MLTSVHVKGYRCFEEFKLTGLSRVNLLVGRNNSGKTALLECVHLLASGGDVSVLVDSARNRGEWGTSGRDERAAPDFSHLFHRHDIKAGTIFDVLSDNGLPGIRVEVITADQSEATGRLFETDEGMGPELILRVHRGSGAEREPRDVFLSDRGILFADPRRQTLRSLPDERREGRPIIFISSDSLGASSLGGMWSQILREKREGNVRQAMQILENDIEDIVFEPAPPPYRPPYYVDRAGVLVSFHGDARRIPLGSMGDGMRRLLALAISLSHVKSGFLLIDEIDTGFHYSIMGKMWELVVKTAMASDIQVFATTHSADCVRGLAELCRQNPELKSSVAAHKIERELKQSVTFSGDEILNAVDTDIEIR